jgi:hypothetical protein
MDMNIKIFVVYLLLSTLNSINRCLRAIYRLLFRIDQLYKNRSKKSSHFSNSHKSQIFVLSSLN